MLYENDEESKAFISEVNKRATHSTPRLLLNIKQQGHNLVGGGVGGRDGSVQSFA